MQDIQCICPSKNSPPDKTYDHKHQGPKLNSGVVPPARRPFGKRGKKKGIDVGERKRGKRRASEGGVDILFPPHHTTSIMASSTFEVASEPTPSLEQVPVTSFFSLTGKKALLTGATRGIGASCALALAQAGASCCLVVRPGQTASPHPALKSLPTNAGQKHCVVEADLADMTQVKAIVDKALKFEEMQGQLDILVNCGGIQRRNPSTVFTEEDWDEVSLPSTIVQRCMCDLP